MRISKAWLIGFLLLSACSKGGRDELGGGDTATFVSDPVTGEADEMVSTAAFTDIPKERLITFKACLKDIAVQQSVVSVPFRVMNGSQALPMRSPLTDQSGCLHWVEKFGFEATRKETFYEIERTIEATGQHQGRITVRLGINPWQKGAAAVRDLSVRGSPETRRQADAEKAPAEEAAGLLIEGVETNLDIRGGTSAELRLGFEPKLRRLDLSGSAVSQPLSRGSFRVRAQLFANTPEGKVPFTSELVVEKAELKQSTVRLVGNVSLLRKIRRESSLELSFVAEPLDPSQQLKPVSGRVPLGRLNGLSLGAKAELIPEKVEPAAPISPLLSGSETPKLQAGFELGRITVVQVVVKDLDQSGRPKSLEVEFRAVARNSISPDPILDQPFQISEGGEKQVIRSDDEDGSLRWKRTYDFDFYKRQEPEKHRFSVQGSKYFNSAVVERNVYLNLWEYEAPASVAIDEEKDGAPSPSVVSAQGGGAELTLSSMMAGFVERSFDIDGLLNLSTTRTYRLEIAPEIRRLSRNRGWLAPTGLGNGRFRARFLLETSDEDNPVVIDAREMEVESRNGKIVATVPFRVNDLRLVAVRSRLTVQILPLEDRSSLVSPAYSGSFEMLGGFSIRLEPRKGDISARMALAPRREPTANANGATLFAKSQGLTLLEPAKLSSLGLSDSDLEQFAKTGFASQVGKLCGLFYTESSYNPLSQYKRCVRDPSGWLTFAPTQHVRKVLAAKPQGVPETTSISLSAGVSVSESDSVSKSKSLSTSTGWDAGTKGNIPGLSLLGIDIGIGVSVGQSWSVSKSWSHSKSKGASQGFDQGKSLSTDELRFLIDAEIDRCNVVGLPNAPAASPRYFFCAPKPERKKFTESYYFVSQAMRSGVVQDEGAALTDRPFLALIRGTTRYEQFKKVLQDPSLSLDISKSLPVPAELWKASDPRFDGFFPGLLTQ